MNYFTDPAPAKPKPLKQIWVSDKFHAWLKQTSELSGQPMYALTDQLMELAQQQSKESLHAN